MLALGALAPAARLAANRGAPFAAPQLPAAFTTHGAWNGISPRALLAQYCERQLAWQAPGGSGGGGAPVLYQRLSWQEAQGDAAADGDAAGAGATGTGEAMAVDAAEAPAEPQQQQGRGGKRQRQQKPAQQGGPPAAPPAGEAAAAAAVEEEEDLGGDWEAGEALLPVGVVVLEVPAAALGGRPGPGAAAALRAEEEVGRDDGHAMHALLLAATPSASLTCSALGGCFLLCCWL